MPFVEVDTPLLPGRRSRIHVRDAGAGTPLVLLHSGWGEGGDVYDGRLGEVICPVLLLHGLHDPRTEPGEIEAAGEALPDARIAWVESGHAPHASERSGEEATRLAAGFLRALPP